jgi:hypothetical protein
LSNPLGESSLKILHHLHRCRRILDLGHASAL